MTARTAALSLALGAGCVLQLAAAPPVRPDTADALQRFTAGFSEPHAYRGTRRLEAAGSGQQGWLEAQTEFTPAEGMRYAVTAEGGSGYIRSRVLRSLLEQERELIARGDSATVALAPANYTFAADGFTDDGLARVAITPRRKARALMAGHMFLAPEDGTLRRVEGRLTKNPSFWTSRVDVVRVYQRINGVQVPVLLESTAQLRLLGRSSLRMTYVYTEIDARPVAEAASDTGGAPAADLPKTP